MNRFYFTYGTSETMPFRGGWTEVIADTKEQAINIFNIIHKPRHEGIVNCSFIYTEEEFKTTNMYKENSNFGQGLVEILKIDRILT